MKQNRITWQDALRSCPDALLRREVARRGDDPVGTDPIAAEALNDVSTSRRISVSAICSKTRGAGDACAARDEYCDKLFQLGYTVQQIAVHLGRDVTTIREALSRHRRRIQLT